MTLIVKYAYNLSIIKFSTLAPLVNQGLLAAFGSASLTSKINGKMTNYNFEITKSHNILLRKIK